MKLSPKIATFCPGCGHKNLELKSAPSLIIKTEQKEELSMTENYISVRIAAKSSILLKQDALLAIGKSGLHSPLMQSEN
jgi:hypothetical protein